MTTTLTGSTPAQIVPGRIGVIAFLYFARPVVLPLFLASVAGITPKPPIRWLSSCHIRSALAPPSSYAS